MATQSQANVTLEDLSLYFHLPISEAAKKIGICTTVIKKICRRYGIPRWPQRKLAAILKRISSLERELQFHPQPERRIEIETQLRALLEDRQAILEGRIVETHFSPRDDVTRKRKITDMMDMDSHPHSSSGDEVEESPREAMDIVAPANPSNAMSKTTPSGPRLPGFKILLEAIDSVEAEPIFSPKRLCLDLNHPVAVPIHQNQPGHLNFPPINFRPPYMPAEYLPIQTPYTNSIGTLPPAPFVFDHSMPNPIATYHTQAFNPTLAGSSQMEMAYLKYWDSPRPYF